MNSSVFILAAGLSLSGVAACAQQYQIDRWTIGGGSATGGVYAVSGTIGQPDATVENLRGGSYSLAGGFWSLLAVPTPGAPMLRIQLTSTNTARISWPASASGFALEQKADLSALNWALAPEPIADDGTNRFVIINPPAGTRYYRLIKP